MKASRQGTSQDNPATAEIRQLLEDFEFPASFDFGVSTSGYQVEGGHNGPDDPKNNWYGAEKSGWKQTTGPCSRFIEKHEEDLDRAAWIGLSGFRLGIEWSRLQPGIDPEMKKAPPFSRDAARLYAGIMAKIFDRGMFPAVTLHHWTNPLWAGPDVWLDRARIEELFPAYVDFAVTEVNRILVEEMGRPPIPYYITMNEPAAVPFVAYLLGMFPRGDAKGMNAALICFENVLRAHVIAYRAIHSIYRKNRWPAPTVTLNSFASAVYGMDKMLQDLLLCRTNGISRDGLQAYLNDQRKRFLSRMALVPYAQGPRFLKRGMDLLLDRLLWRKMGKEPFPLLADLIFSGDEPRLIDVLGFDMYDPFIGNNIDIGLPRLIGIRKEPYQWHANASALGPVLEAYSWTSADLPIHILEHGISCRARGLQVEPRHDGLTRDRAIKDIMVQAVIALKAGVRLGAYYHWSLIDNYEWGSFEPRFGLFGVHYHDGARRLNTDIMGIHAAGAYQRFVQAFKSHDKALLERAFVDTRYPVFGR